MPIQFVSGDLFANEYSVAAFAQGCNCQGSMGAGIAKTFREKYPAMYEAYRGRCKAQPRQFNLGDCWFWREPGLPSVFNLATQEGYWHARATYEAIEQSLLAMRREADRLGVATIAMPRIGAGHGGLSWRKVRAIIEAAFGGWEGELVVYEEFVPSATKSPKSSRTRRTPAEPEVSKASAAESKRSGRSKRTKSPTGNTGVEAIKFYSVSGAYGGFSNFSPHPIVLAGKTWPTSEHYFQAQKFAGTPDEEEVRQAKSPMIAARMGRNRKRPLRADWQSVKDRIMHEAVLAKFTQHADLRALLLATGDALIVEHTANDAYWADGGDGSGKNRLGQILMDVRKKLRGSVNEC